MADKEELKYIRTKIINEILEFASMDLNNLSIRETDQLINHLECSTEIKFIRLDMGIPGILPEKIGIEAEIKALKTNVASKYPPIQGIKEVKMEMSRFLKMFLDIDLSPEGCIPTVGSIQASLIAFMMTSRIFSDRNKTLFIDPGFPVHKLQHKILKLPFESIDIYNLREKELKKALRKYILDNGISSIVYSNPNNPTWLCLSESELKYIAELAIEFDLVIIEDLAYFGMDRRKDYMKRGEPPFQPSISRYTDNYILLFSSSKIFSYAGQRIATCCMSDTLFNRKFPELLNYFSYDTFGKALIYGPLYALCAGITHTTQYALASMLKASSNGTLDISKSAKFYENKSVNIKKIFIQNGFNIEYDNDNEPLGNGFYFTVNYPFLNSTELFVELLYIGIGTISLKQTGSKNNRGVRIGVSIIAETEMEELERRIKYFNEMHCYNITSLRKE